MVVKMPDVSAWLCVDFSVGFNYAVQVHQHSLPLPEIFSLPLIGGHVFSQMDFSNAYLQVELDDDSKQLCNINTHRGV